MDDATDDAVTGRDAGTASARSAPPTNASVPGPATVVAPPGDAGAPGKAAASDPPAAGVRPPPKPPKNPATSGQKVMMFAVLVLITFAMLVFARAAVRDVDEFQQRTNSVRWDAPQGMTLKPGPPSFWYDAANKRLNYVGVIDQQRKLELVGLLTTDTDKPVAAEQKSYWAAIDELAYASNHGLGGLVISLLLLGGLAGALGVQLRSLVNFVGNACYTESLDLVIWWPYYFVRPLTGLVLGIVVVVVVNAGFLGAGSVAPGGTLWWAGVAFLAGYGEQEFTLRLRQLTKTLFGEAK